MGKKTESLEQVNLRLVGVAPLLMRNGRLADPNDEYTRALKEIKDVKASKRSEEQWAELAKRDWWGGLYTDPENTRVVLPADVIWSAGLAGAKKKRRGKEFQSAVVEADPFYPLEYDGPQDLNALYEDKRFVLRKIVKESGKTPRTRPRFFPWSVRIALLVNVGIVDAEHVVVAYEDAGRLCGIGDWKPRHGRFGVEVI